MSANPLMRLRSQFLAVAAVVAAIAAFDVSMALACGYRPQWLPAQVPWEPIPRFQSHIAAVESLERAGKLDDHHLVVVLGSSAVEYDFDCQVLHANDPLHRHWLILGAGASNFAQLEIYARVLIDSSLRPSLVLIGLQRSLTHREDDDSPVPVEISLRQFPRDLIAHRFGYALRDCAWLFRNRDLLDNANRALMFSAGALVRTTFGLPTSVAQTPAPDPWDVTDLSALHGGEADRAGKWRYRMELLRPAHYQPADRTINALVRLVGELRRRGATVAGVLVPESARLRAAYPPIAVGSFRDALAAVAATGQSMTIVDLQASIPDDLFYDDSHLNTPGKRMFCAALPALFTEGLH